LTIDGSSSMIRILDIFIFDFAIYDFGFAIQSIGAQGKVRVKTG
jgi:hypothetical protein